MLISECFVLCVSDVDQVPVFFHAFVPDPDIGNVPVTGIAVQSGGDVSLQVNAVWICGDGVVPAVHGRWFQNQPLFRGDGLRIADPVVDVEWGFCRLRRLRRGGLDVPAALAVFSGGAPEYHGMCRAF